MVLDPLKTSRISSSSTGTRPDSKRFSVVASYWSYASENDAEVQDELAKLQKELRAMKLNISTQSKRNFLLERDVRFLDGRIALLIQNRMALNEQQDVADRLAEVELSEGNAAVLDDRKRQLYGNLFHLVQSEPKHIAGLTRVVSLSQIETLLQTVMFTIFGNQYETREEYLLLSMFQNILAAEFESATNFAGLMRANTPVSRMMTTYTRRSPGQAYLKQILSDRVNKIMDLSDLDLEINPLKVYDRLISEIVEKHGSCSLPRNITAEQAANHPDVKALIAPRVNTLMEIGASFLSAIMSSVDEIPYGIRWICKQIRSLTKRKFQDSSEAQKCSLIGGFFMLRYVNPALVTPQAYMLIGKEPQANTKRTLTLVAKLLQNLANKPTVTKEPFMSVLNPFVEHNEVRFQKFLNQICEVGDFYEALEMEQYIVLSKKEIDLKINLNELYSTHQFLNQYIDVLSPEKDSHLRICLKDLGPAPAQLPRSENRVITLSIFSRWDKTSNLADNNQASTSLLASDSLTSNEFMYHDLKAVLVHLARAFGMQHHRQINILEILDTACACRNEGLMQKGERGREIYQSLSKIGVIDSKEGDRLLEEEVAEELLHLGSLASSIEKEIKSLSKVFKTVQEHNTYLKAQLLTYKSYLQNVRVQTMPGQTLKKDTPLSERNGNGSGTNGQVGGKSSGGKQSSSDFKSVLKLPYAKLENDRVIVDSNIPSHRRANIFFKISAPVPGTFLIELHYSGREQAILELELTLDDLLEKQQMGVSFLDLEYVKMDVGKTLILLNQSFVKSTMKRK